MVISHITITSKLYFMHPCEEMTKNIKRHLFTLRAFLLFSLGRDLLG